MAVPAAPVIRARSNSLDVVRVRCEVPAGTTSFKVYRDDSPSAATTLIDTVTPADLTVPFIYFDKVGGAAGLILDYRVVAVNADGDSAFSNEERVATESYSLGSGEPTAALRINRSDV